MILWLIKLKGSLGDGLWIGGKCGIMGLCHCSSVGRAAHS